MARHMHCNALLNISGTIALDIMNTKINPLPYGIRAIVGLYQPKQVTRYLVDLGVRVLFFFMSVDSPIAHVGCPYSRPNVFHIRSVNSSHEVILPDGTISQAGEGAYVSTIPETPFPWIRYANGDRVTIFEGVCTCGFAGRSLTFKGRESSAKIGSGPNVNCDDVYRYYASKGGNGRVVILFGRVDSGDFSHRLVLRFLLLGSPHRASTLGI